MKIKIVRVGCLMLSFIFFSGCSALQSLLGAAKIKPPQVEFVGAKLDKLSFDKADFLFNLQIRNPNPLEIKLAGFDYEFLINSASFLKGTQEEKLEISANGKNTIQLPLSFRFIDLYQTFQSLRVQDESTYQLTCGFSFNLPVLGTVRIPVSKAGNFPLLKLPTVNLDSLKLKGLGLSGADLQLRLRMNNPNAFAMLLERLQYQLKINGKRWASGDTSQAMQITEKGESLIEIPITLNFLQIGGSVYQLLKGEQRVSYQLQGGLNLKTSLPLLGQVTLPFEQLGQIEIAK